MKDVNAYLWFCLFILLSTIVGAQSLEFTGDAAQDFYDIQFASSTINDYHTYDVEVPAGTVFPNPTQGEIYLTANQTLEGATLPIVNALGGLIKEQVLNLEKNLPLYIALRNQLKSGEQYCIEVSQKNKPPAKTSFTVLLQ